MELKVYCCFGKYLELLSFCNKTEDALPFYEGFTLILNLFQAKNLQYQDVMMLMNVITLMATVSILATTQWGPITVYVMMATLSVAMVLAVSM